MKRKAKQFKDNPSDAAILAWLDGELDGFAAEAFSARVQVDPELRARVERTREALAAAQEWMLADSPGAERVDGLPVPPLEAPARVVELGPRVGPPESAAWRGRAWLARGMAAAAIFAIGFLAGQFSMKRTDTPVAMGPTMVPSRPVATPPPSVTATPEPVKVNHPAERVVAQAAATRGWAQPTAPPAPAAREEGGRVIVETTLAGSGGRALWVVDGGFDVAANTVERKGK